MAFYSRDNRAFFKHCHCFTKGEAVNGKGEAVKAIFVNNLFLHLAVKAYG